MPITFLFTDIEKSSILWEQYRERMGKVLSLHDRILQDEIQHHGGKIIKHTGDGVFAVFENGDPLGCAIHIQKHIQKQDWGTPLEIRLRVGLHTGEAECRVLDSNQYHSWQKVEYFGTDVNLAAQLADAAWGGMIVLTPEVAESHALPPQAITMDLGIHQLTRGGKYLTIYQLNHPELHFQDFPPLPTISSHPNNLPIQSTPFLGREREMEIIQGMLNNPNNRLITLLGPGGVGKTRLALRIASQCLPTFQHGAFYVPLSAISSPDLLITTIADELNFSFYSSDNPKDQLFDYLCTKNMLLIMDSFEHMISASSFLSELLEVAPNIQILTTSQVRLNLLGEEVLFIKGLDFPLQEQRDVEQYSAVRLFIQCVRRSNPDYKPTTADLPHIVKLCRLLEGFPLAIELAAPWVQVLDCASIVKNIQVSFDFLETTYHDLPTRHRSLRAVFNHSWELLTEPEQQIYRSLAVFRGMFHFNAAHTVSGVTLPMVRTLVDKSLIRREKAGYFRLHPLLNQYINEKLFMNPEDQHNTMLKFVSYYMDLLSSHGKNLRGFHQKRALNEIGAEIENVRKAWSLAVKNGNLKEIAKAAETLALYYEIKSWFVEGEAIFRKAAASFEMDKPSGLQGMLFGTILCHQGLFTGRLGKLTESIRLLRRGLDILQAYREPHHIATCLNYLATMQWLSGDYKNASKSARESLKIWRSIKDDWGEAFALNCLGNIAWDTMKLQKGKEYYQASLELRRKINDHFGTAVCINNLGYAAQELGDFQEAKKLHKESLKIHHELGNQTGIGMSLSNIGFVSYCLGEYVEAINAIEESLAIREDTGNRSKIAFSQYLLGITYKEMGDLDNAVQILEKAMKTFEELGAEIEAAHSQHQLGVLAWLQGRPEDAMNILNQSLKVVEDLDDLWGIAFSHLQIAKILEAESSFTPSREHYVKSLATSLKSREEALILEILINISSLWVKEGKIEQAYSLLDALHQRPACVHHTRNQAKALMQTMETDVPATRLVSLKNAKQDMGLLDWGADTLNKLRKS
ncbi:MAG: tetratricopeptide repeat protein [Chloroflexota bacterium]